MVNQTIWIGIVIVVFFVGIGVSYAIFDINEPVQMTDEEHINTMIYDPEIHDAMMKIMMEDEEFMNQMQCPSPCLDLHLIRNVNDH